MPRGDVYDLPIDLPCAQALGIPHHAFAVSGDEYMNENGLAILISTTTGASGQVRKPFAFYVKDAAIYRALSGRPFELYRPITPTLLGTFELSSLPHKVGELEQGFFSGAGCTGGYGADDVLRVQFQLPGRMQSLAKLYGHSTRDVSRVGLGHAVGVERLSVWSVRGRESPWLIVSNDKNNHLTGYVHAIELRRFQAAPGYPATKLEPPDNTLAEHFFLGPELKVFCKPGAGQPPDMLLTVLGNVLALEKVDAHMMCILGLF